MKRDIILSGVGGQGILTIAATIGTAALKEGLHIKQSEVHGMSQRGGEVQAHLRISSEIIHSDLIPKGKADMIISMEPLESLRYVSFLKPDGWIISNTQPTVNIDNYPDLDKIHEEIRTFPKQRLLDAEAIARKAGSAKASNVVLLAAASDLIGISRVTLESTIENLFKHKGERILNLNRKAFQFGVDMIENELQHA